MQRRSDGNPMRFSASSIRLLISGIDSIDFFDRLFPYSPGFDLPNESHASVIAERWEEWDFAELTKMLSRK